MKRILNKFVQNKSYTRNSVLYFKTPMREKEFTVTPRLSVPDDIVAPEYVKSKKPLFGVYEGMPTVHKEETVRKLKVAAALAAKTAEYGLSLIREGVTTDEIDRKVHEFIISHKAYPTALGFMNFPKSLCTSVNEVCCHGIPNTRPLQNGDTINLDITLYLDGVHGDTSVMGMVGEVHPDIKKLIEVTQTSLYEAIKVCGPGVPYSRIGDVIEDIAEEHNYTVCELFTGHGIGPLLHMPPMVLHTRNDFPWVMQKGSVFTIEPIILLKGKPKYEWWKDNFTVLAANNPSAQWEHTISITDNGYEILTLRKDDNFK